MTREKPAYPATHSQFLHGQFVQKKSGGRWRGRVVGWYATTLTPEGYAVESMFEPGSVQIYPASALERMQGTPTGFDGQNLPPLGHGDRD